MEHEDNVSASKEQKDLRNSEIVCRTLSNKSEPCNNGGEDVILSDKHETEMPEKLQKQVNGHPLVIDTSSNHTSLRDGHESDDLDLHHLSEEVAHISPQSPSVPAGRNGEIHHSSEDVAQTSIQSPVVSVRSKIPTLCHSDFATRKAQLQYIEGEDEKVRQPLCLI